MLEDYIEKGKGAVCNIICTQPRRLSAIGLADRVSKERGQAVGETVSLHDPHESFHGSAWKLTLVEVLCVEALFACPAFCRAQLSQQPCLFDLVLVLEFYFIIGT